MKNEVKIITKPEKIANILYLAIRRYSKARKQEKKKGLAVDTSREKSVTVIIKNDKSENNLENNNDSEKRK